MAGRPQARLTPLVALGACACAVLRPAPAPAPVGADGSPEASAFAAAEAWHRDGDPARARAALQDLLARAGLGAADRVRALTERAVLDLEGGELEAAERSLGAALAAADGPPPAAGLPPFARPKADYWLGEVARARFLAAPLDLAGASGPEGDGPLLAQLQRKSDLLLEAQARYLRALSPGAGSFGVAAVARVGDLYEALHGELREAPPPAGLDGGRAASFRAELEARLEVLAAKAVEAYQTALDAARRAGVEGELVKDAEAALERMGRRAGAGVRARG